MTDLNEHEMAKLAREMVMCVRNYKAIFKDFGITEEDYYNLLNNEYYKKLKEHYTIEWNATTSTADRVKVHGQAGTEVLLPAVIKRALMPEEPMSSMIEALKMSAKIGGLGEAKGEQKNAADRFVITINLGADVNGKPVIEHYDKPIEIGTGGDLSK
jgi:hypothetical protein